MGWVPHAQEELSRFTKLLTEPDEAAEEEVCCDKLIDCGFSLLFIYFSYCLCQDLMLHFIMLPFIILVLYLTQQAIRQVHARVYASFIDDTLSHPRAGVYHCSYEWHSIWVNHLFVLMFI